MEPYSADVTVEFGIGYFRTVRIDSSVAGGIVIHSRGHCHLCYRLYARARATASTCLRATISNRTLHQRVLDV